MSGLRQVQSNGFLLGNTTQPASRWCLLHCVIGRIHYQWLFNKKYKGVRRPEIGKPKPIIIDGNFDDWKDVRPEFRMI